MIISKKSTHTLKTGDDDTSLESSRHNGRRLQRSSDRNSSRSYSRESNTSSFKNFYVKNVWTKDLNYDQIQKANQCIEEVKKRQPTPCKSKKHLANLNSSPIFNKQKQKLRKLEKEIALDQFEQKIQQRNLELKRIRKTLQMKQQHINKLQKLIQQKQEKIVKLTYINQEANKKIYQLEQTVLRNQQSIATTNNNLQRLKKSIQENRLGDLKKENQGYKHKINQLNVQLENLLKLGDQAKLKIGQLEKQNTALKGKIALEFDLKNESMKENYLQAQINRLKDLLSKSRSSIQKQMTQRLNKNEEQKNKLKSESKKLLIKLDYIHRKHVQQIKLLTKTKAQEISKYKNKYKLLYNELMNKERQLQSKVRLGKQVSNRNSSRLKLLSQIDKDSKADSQYLSCEIEKNRLLTLSFELSSDND